MRHDPKPGKTCREMVDAEVVDRRGFLTSLTSTAAVGVFGAGIGNAVATSAAPNPKSAAETSVKTLYDTLTAAQKKTICFPWDHKDPERGLLRTHVSNFWHVTKPMLTESFYTKEQQAILFDIFKGVFNPDCGTSE